MTRRRLIPLILTAASVIAFSGCGGMNTWISTAKNPPIAEAPHDTTEESHGDSLIVSGNSVKVEFEEAERDAEWLKLSSQEKLDSVAMLLDLAVSHQEDGDNTVAEFYFHGAREKLGEIEYLADESERLDYLRLEIEIDLHYREFVTALDTIPAQSSPDAVMMGIDLAEGDSAVVDSLFLEKPEVTFGSAAVDSALEASVEFPQVPVVRNRKVENAINFFRHKGRKVFTVWLARSEYYIPQMQKILREEGLPEELVYLSMIESGFNPKAYSYAHASGPWQFIRSTGRIFGLYSDWWYDERRDPVKSTLAACKYLKKLYLEFEDWYLALAAYNCGEARVRRHMRRYNTRDFWKLKRLPRQTRNYVPTYLAAMTIAQNPAEYGFDEVVHKNPLPNDSVVVRECLDLTLVANILDTSYTAVKALNPAIVRWCTPPTRDSIWLYIPQGTVDKFVEGLSAVPESSKRSWVRHRVRPGETLSTIARRYGTSMKAIRDIKANRIYSYHKIRAGKHLLVPVPPGKYSEKWAVNNQLESSNKFIPREAASGRQRVVYTVRKGDNLSTIAQRYHTSVGSLKRWNRLWGKRFIYPGQKLVVYTPVEAGEDYTRNIPKNTDSSGEYHKVRQGESLWLIAQSYGTSVDELKDLNGLTGRCVIRPGDKIRVKNEKKEDKILDLSLVKSAEAGESKLIVYVVRKGDTLWEISRAFGVPVSEIRKYNALGRRNLIKPGEKLLIPRK